MTVLLAIVVMALFFGALSLRMIVKGEAEVRRPGCSSFNAAMGESEGSCAVCGAPKADDCRLEEEDRTLQSMRN